jgi:Rad3-related DNA helicase
VTPPTEKLDDPADIPALMGAISALVVAQALTAAGASLLKRLSLHAALIYRYADPLEEHAGPREDMIGVLQRVSSSAADLEKALSELPSSTEPVLARRFIWDAASPKDAGLDLDKLVQDLRQLSANACDIIPLIPKRGRGNPGFRKVARAIRYILPGVEEAFGTPVGTSESIGSIKQKNLRGPGGDFIRALFDIIDPGVTESTLTRKVAEVHKLMENPTPEFLDETADLRS